METKLTRKLRDQEAALSNCCDSLTLEPALFPDPVADQLSHIYRQELAETIRLRMFMW